MHSRGSGRALLVLFFLFLLLNPLSNVLYAQNVAQFPVGRSSANDCGCPRGDDGIPVSSGLLTPFLPRVPNLEFGFLYYFGKNVRTGRFSADYVRAFHLNRDSVLFGEAHAEGWEFWKRSAVEVGAAPGFTTITSATSNRVDLSFGGGYRTMLGANTLVGVNGFYDTSRLFDRWYSSGGFGLEYAAKLAADDAIDLNFNWYGNIFNRDILVNVFRNKGNSFDVEAGYSHALFDQALDLRLKVIGYQFDAGNPVRGWRGGADLTTRDGVFTLRYEYGSDRLNGDYNTVGGFVTVGFQPENLLSGESPFTLPEPVFRSPRDLRRLLGLKVKRNWYQPAAVVLARSRAIEPSQPALPCSDYLSGTVVRGAALVEGTRYGAGDVPPMSSTGVTICWCNLINTGQTFATNSISDGANVYDLTGVVNPLGRTSGCGNHIITVVGGAGTPNGFEIATGGPALLFGPGGGDFNNVQSIERARLPVGDNMARTGSSAHRVG